MLTLRTSRTVNSNFTRTDRHVTGHRRVEEYRQIAEENQPVNPVDAEPAVFLPLIGCGEGQHSLALIFVAFLWALAGTIRMRCKTGAKRLAITVIPASGRVIPSTQANGASSNRLDFPDSEFSEFYPRRNRSRCSYSSSSTSLESIFSQLSSNDA